MLNDLRFALRILLKNPGFTAVAVLTLALGIGGTTAIFSVIQCAVLDPFPYADSHRLAVLVAHKGQAVYPVRISAREFLDYSEENRVFDEVIGWDEGTDTGAPEWLTAAHVTGNTFRVLGVPPVLGRALIPEDSKPGAPPVVVLSYKAWTSKFGRDAGIVGRTVIMNHRATTVVGVMPPRFGWTGKDVWFPATLHKGKATDPMDYFSLVGRLKAGVSIEQAAADVVVLAKRFAAAYVKDHPKEKTFGVEGLVESPVVDPNIEELRKTLFFLLAAVGLLLLIACVNVANLLVARSIDREKEIAIRASMGASGGRLARQLLIESLLLALGGAALGCVLAWDLLGGLVALLPYSLPNEVAIRINGPVLLFTLVATLVSTLLFGLGPALHAVRKDLQEPLKASSKGGGESLRHRRLQNLLVVSEVTLSLVLLTGASLLIRSFFALHRVELGYNPDKVLVAIASLPEEKYKTTEQRNQFHLELLRRVRSLPGVVSAALGWPPPPNNDITDTAIEIAGKPSPDNWHAGLHHAGDRFFETFGIRLLQGRTISEEDMAHTRKVAVVNRTFVGKYFGSEIPLGRQIKVKALAIGSQSIESPWFEVVGVVADVRDEWLGPNTPVQPEIYLPYTVLGNPFAYFFVRTHAEPALLSNSLRREVAAIDKELPLLSSWMAHDILDGPWFSGPRFMLTMLVAFASLGLLLVSVGVYSVLSYAVSRRTQEIGIRMALGAEATDVRRMVMMSGLRWLLVGIGIGVPVSIALAKILQNRIWGIKSADPLTLIAVSLLLTLVGLAACYIPARRATKVDPIVALRYE